MRTTALSLCLALLCAALLIASAWIGTAPLDHDEIVSALLLQGDAAARVIVWEIRLPRAVAAFGVGAALGLAGAALQGLLQNPLAEPGVLGVSSASSLGAICVLYFGLGSAGGWLVMAAAIGFSFMAMLLLLALTGARAQTVQLILVGLGLSSFCGALVSLAFNLAPNPYSLSDLVNWLLGSVANRSWMDLLLVLPVWLIGAALVLRARGGLRALSLGEEVATSLGVDPARTRLLTIAGTALLTGASVALAGVIGFVGIVAPHLVRPLVRHDPGDTLVPAALMGGLCLLAADAIVRTLAFEPEMKLGVAAALIGAPMFIWIAARQGGLSR